MKELLSELSLIIIVALLAVSIVELQPTSDSPIPTDPSMPIQEKTQLYETHPDMLLVSFTVYLTQTPIIDEVKLLPEGRLSKPLTGENRLKLIDNDGQIIYTLSFLANFDLLDASARSPNHMNYAYVLPYTDQVAKIVLSTPQGETVYNIQADLKGQLQ